MTTKADHHIKTFSDFLEAGDGFRFEDVDPELMTLTIKIHGDQFESSITGEVAKAIGSLQAALYRAAAEILHNEPNIKLLTAEEKDLFEIVVQVKTGCSLLKIPGYKYLPPLLGKMVEKMESKHIAIVACFAVAGFTGCQISDDVTDAWKSNAATQAMVEQARILNAPINGAIQSGGVDLAKAAKNANALEIGDRRFDRQEIENLNKRAAKQAAQVETYQAECIVKGIRDDGKNLRVDLLDTNSNETFSAIILPRGLLDQDMPVKPTEIAPLMESKERVLITVLIKETRAKTERLLVDFEIVTEETALDKPN